MNDPSQIGMLTLQSLRRDFDAKFAVDCLTEATLGEFYIFGGSVRNIVLQRPRSGDLDLMIPNGDLRAIEELDRLGVPYHFNSQGHRRYVWNRLQIDIFEPKDFFREFSTVEDAVAYFDLRINALAVHAGSAKILDPLGSLVRQNPYDPEINWRRWDESDLKDLAVLILRLARLLHDNPELRLSRGDADRIQSTVLPKIAELDWSLVKHRFPAGKERFLAAYEDLIK